MSAFRRRIERKYCVSEHEAATALRVAALFLERDRGLTEPQRITSLYLDSPALTFFSWQQARRRRRFKLRFRAYGSDAPAVVYAEIKNKTDRWVFKQRAAVPVESVAAMCEVRSLCRRRRAAQAISEDENLEAFHQRLWTFGALPQLLIRSEREAFRGRWEEAAVAVTVDRAIEFQRTWSPALRGHPARWSRLPLPEATRGAHAILEIKHGAEAPRWMQGLTRTLAPFRVSFSKYATAMRQMQRPEGAGRPRGCRGTLPRQREMPRYVRQYDLGRAPS